MSDFEPLDKYEHGDLIEGGPYVLSQHISQILASGAHFQYVDANVIEVIRPGKDEVIVFNNGTVLTPPAEKKVEPEAKLEHAAQLIKEYNEENPSTPPTEIVEAPGLVDAPPVVEAVTVVEKPEPAPTPKTPRGRKPKAVVAEDAPAKVPAPAEVEEN